MNKTAVITLAERPEEKHPYFDMEPISAKDAWAVLMAGALVVGYAEMSVIARARHDLGIEAELPTVGGDGIPQFNNPGEKLMVIYALPGQELTYELGTFKGTGDLMSTGLETIESGTIE